MKTSVIETNNFKKEEKRLMSSGYEVDQYMQDKMVYTKTKYGNPGIHIAIFIFLGWWLALIPNGLYLWYAYVNNSKKVIVYKTSETSDS